MTNLFLKYQQPLLKLANSFWGRKFLGISQEVKDKIVGLTPNSYFTQKGRNKYQATFRCYNLFEKKLGGALKFSDSLLEGIKYYFTPQEFRWLEYCASPETFYSTDLGDGSLGNGGTPAWSTHRSAASSGTVEHTSTLRIDAVIDSGNYTIVRCFIPYNTASLNTAGLAITDGVLKLFVSSISDANSTSAVLAISTQTDPTTLAVDDYNNITLDSPTELASRIAFSGMSTVAYTDFTLNAAGLAAITTTGYTKYVVRDSRDVDNSAPTGVNRNYFFATEQAGTDKDPKLVVTYTLPSFFALF